MLDKKNKRLIILSAVGIFLILFSLFFFGYFMPVKYEHNKIAKLPSHDLTHFIDEYGNIAYNTMYYPVTYNGRECRTKEDFQEVLNHDTFAGSMGYHYFYDMEHNLFLRLGMDTDFRLGDGRAIFSIDDYVDFAMYYDTPVDPFVRGLGLGPVLSWLYELFDSNSSTAGTVASSRYWFIYQDKVHKVEVPILSASLQLALAFTIYLIPLLACVVLRRKIIVFYTIGIYVLVFIGNIVYYTSNYSWMSW